MKTKILIFIDWFYPAYKAGGPIKSVYNLIQNLKSDFSFFVVTGESDIDGTLVNAPIYQYENVPIAGWEEIQLNQWIAKEGYEVIYLSPERQRASVYKALAKEKQADWAYYNSLFSKNFTLKPYKALKKSDIKQMIAPRGMLGVGALSIKPFKKKVFLKAAKEFLFDKETFWHATSQQEANEISKELKVLNDKIRVASNLASPLVQDFKTLRKQDFKIRLFFLSRISKKKNLLFILELLQEMPELENLVFDIYGPIEKDGHWEKCKPIVDQDSRINYKGEIHPQAIRDMIAEYHLMVLPTLHENYGHVIAETLSQGRPVLISDQTPWRDLEAKNIGFDLPLDNPQAWKEKLIQIYEMADEQIQQMCKNSFEYARENIVNSSLIQASKALFKTNDQS